MSSLPTPLRRHLENTVKQARKVATAGARKALEALAVHEPAPYLYMDDGQTELRRKLRAQAKQLGDRENPVMPGSCEIRHLIEKLAYDQWHRLLFARYLVESDLLISPEHGVAVSLDDCEELAPSLQMKDAWAVAAHFAAKELPEIFRADDPAGAVELPAENRKPLIQLVTGLPVEVFIANDSLGWCYQFWQSERKDEVNAAGHKIGADELPAVTQLFTEDYMVDFLLDNTLGAWHAGRVLAAMEPLSASAQNEDELRKAVALPGCPWKYLRFIRADDGRWTPAAGIFEGWPKTAKEVTCLDPCMGSGHFVVAMFERLVALRIEEETLNEVAAVTAVIRDNLYGLEIEPRCTQIAAFNLALAAWRRVSHCKLPTMNLACSGLAPNAKKEDWLKLAGDNYRLQNGMERLYMLFKDAPLLGSLINPRTAEGDLLEAAFHELQPLLEMALAQETKDDTAHEMAVTARSLAKAAELLVGQFTLVATNVPYLLRRKQTDHLKEFCAKTAPEAKSDLATVFVIRCLKACVNRGAVAVVTPQTWMSQDYHQGFRTEMLTNFEWHLHSILGSGAFETITGEIVKPALSIFVNARSDDQGAFFSLDASKEKTLSDKAGALRDKHLLHIRQTDQLKNPESRIILTEPSKLPRLEDVASYNYGICTGDKLRFLRCFWEIPSLGKEWSAQRTTVEETSHHDGMQEILLWESGNGSLLSFVKDRLGPTGTGAWIRGAEAWGKSGVIVSAMGSLPVSLYHGELFDENTVAIVPHERTHLPAIWAFMISPQYHDLVRQIDQSLKVISPLVKVPFDLKHWQTVAAEKYPDGLPRPNSNDPTQWLFNGRPQGSDQPLHVAVERLLGYQWPRQTGSSFPDCSALGADGLEKLADQDGIVCISAAKGEAPAAERLRRLLVQAFGTFDLNALVASAGPKGSKSNTVEEWLRDEFFEQHCALFHHRPFIWHLWDGHKSGFSALVNYHQLNKANLEKLAYAYLGDWLRRQQAAVDAGEAGSDARLEAARQLQAKLKLILEGEPPYDLFVRWKPLSKQAIGWQPDLNDGVRMNIRPFATADILRKRVKIKWDKDRGKEPVREQNHFPWFWGWDGKSQDFAGVGTEPDGNRWNDCHLTNKFKREARMAE